MAQKKIALAPIIAVIAVISLVLVNCARADAPTEYQLKAAFLYKFAKFVEWPAGTFQDSSSPILIGVLGEDPFGNSLDETVKGKTVDNRRLVIKHANSVGDLMNCQIIFVSASENGRMSKIVDKLKGQSILTVGESDRFARLGGIINFDMQDNRISLQVNVEEAKRSKLKISSKLLRLADIVGD